MRNCYFNIETEYNNINNHRPNDTFIRKNSSTLLEQSCIYTHNDCTM